MTPEIYQIDSGPVVILKVMLMPFHVILMQVVTSLTFLTDGMEVIKSLD